MGCAPALRNASFSEFDWAIAGKGFPNGKAKVSKSMADAMYQDGVSKTMAHAGKS